MMHGGKYMQTPILDLQDIHVFGHRQVMLLAGKNSDSEVDASHVLLPNVEP